MSIRVGSLTLVSLALVLGACSSDDSPAGGATGGNAGAGGSSSQGTCDASKLVGVWSGTSYSMEILSDMTYRASGTPNMASIDVNGTLQVSGCDVTIVDTSGQYACPSTDIGAYTFTATETTLSFTLVSDPCDGRRIPLTAGSLTKS